MEDKIRFITNFAIDQAMLEAGESREPLGSEDDERLVRYALSAPNHMTGISKEFDSAYGAMELLCGFFAEGRASGPDKILVHFALFCKDVQSVAVDSSYCQTKSSTCRAYNNRCLI